MLRSPALIDRLNALLSVCFVACPEVAFNQITRSSATRCRCRGAARASSSSRASTNVEVVSRLRWYLRDVDQAHQKANKEAGISN